LTYFHVACVLTAVVQGEYVGCINISVLNSHWWPGINLIDDVSYRPWLVLQKRENENILERWKRPHLGVSAE
jgi:hypothetical protein